MRRDGVVGDVSPDDLKDEDLKVCCGGKSSRTVGMEKLPGDEYVPNSRYPENMANCG